jgi:hypothetical protein
MQTGHEYRRLVVKLIDANPRTNRPSVRFQETWETLVPGLASIAMGLALLIVACLGMQAVYASQHLVNGSAQGRSAAASYFAPNWQSVVAAVAGECLGLAGLIAGKWRRETISIVCVLGTAVCFLQMILVCVQVLLLT